MAEQKCNSKQSDFDVAQAEQVLWLFKQQQVLACETSEGDIFWVGQQTTRSDLPSFLVVIPGWVGRVGFGGVIPGWVGQVGFGGVGSGAGLGVGGALCTINQFLSL